MNYSLIPTAQAIVQHFQAKNITNIVISPGSRNAPLIIAFAENPSFSCYSIVDERCAAFFALGMAQQLQKPVAVICTSGSALLNYYPAVAEAFYSNIPLVVISADRPSYKIGIGDGQTINQKNVFDNQIGYSANLRQDINHSTDKILQYRPEWINDKNVPEVQQGVQAYNDAELNKVLDLAITAKCPVHINVPFEEPLYKTLQEPSILADIKLVVLDAESTPSLQAKKDIWRKAIKKIVLVGVNSPNSIDEVTLKKLANDPSVLVFTETTSNLFDPNFFNSIDAIIAPIEMSENAEVRFKELQPEILVTFGGLIVSKKIKAFLRSFSPKHHWHVGDTIANDTFFCLEEHIKVTVGYFFKNIYEQSIGVESDYFDVWNKVKKQYTSKRVTYLNQIPFSDFLVFNEVLKCIPNHYVLQLANSSTIRYTQLFDLNSTLKVFCNRGTSGIDGSTSTAIGASLINETPTLFITGDLSFFYDSNALWNNYIKNNFRIIIVNNKGGGIFRILPSKNDTEIFETYFETRHDLNAQQLCNMYGFDYRTANTTETLLIEMDSFFENSGQPKLLEIVTPSLINDKILMDYFRFIS